MVALYEVKQYPPCGLSQVQRGPKRWSFAGILQLQNWPASLWRSALYPGGCANRDVLPFSSIGSCDVSSSRMHCHLHLLTSNRIKWRSPLQLVPREETFVQAHSNFCCFNTAQRLRLQVTMETTVILPSSCSWPFYTTRQPSKAKETCLTTGPWLKYMEFWQN